eukprot:gene15983-19009_t
MDIIKAQKLGATLDTTSTGFHSRNTKVAKSQHIVAFTFSTLPGPCTGVSTSQDDSLWMTCTAPLGSGTNQILSVTIESRTDTLVFAYNAPAITSNTQDGTQVVFVGSNFGNDATKLTLSPAYEVVSVTDTQITATLPLTARNEPVSATVSGQASSPFNLNIQPVISSVSHASHMVVMLPNSEATTMVSLVDTETFTFSKVLVEGSSFICTLSSTHSFNAVTFTLTIDTLTPPAITASTSVYYLVGGKITLTGDHFIEPVQVSVASSVCQTPVFISRTSLTCIYDGSVAPLAAGLPFTVVADSLQSTATVFNYTIDPCPESCSTHGTCVSAEGGNVSLPSPNINFDAIIHSIVEGDATSAVVKTVEISTLSWTTLSTSEDLVSTRSIFTGSIVSEDFQLIVEARLFNTSHIVHFAGQQVPTQAQSLKHTVTINKWSFAAPSNTLKVIYRASYPTQTLFDCDNSTTVASYQPSKTDIKSLTIDSPLGTFVASFSNRVNADNVISILAIDLVEEATTDNLTSHVDIALHVPHFTETLIVDPTFTAATKTIAQRTGDDCKPRSSSKKNKWLIPFVVVCSIVGAALIAGGVYLIVKKTKQAKGSNGIAMK